MGLTMRTLCVAPSLSPSSFPPTLLLLLLRVWLFSGLHPCGNPTRGAMFRTSVPCVPQVLFMTCRFDGLTSRVAIALRAAVQAATTLGLTHRQCVREVSDFLVLCVLYCLCDSSVSDFECVHLCEYVASVMVTRCHQRSSSGQREEQWNAAALSPRV